MCGRYGFIPAKNFYSRFEIEDPEVEVEENLNVTPGQVMPVVRAGEQESGRAGVNTFKKVVEKMRWGLVPFWAKDPRIGYKMINARAEEIENKPSFREPFKKRRCLVPASGFFEWKREGNEKQAWYFQLRDEEMFCFAGLYDIWKDGEGRELKTYTIITTSPNKLVDKIHDRMPVILTRKAEDIWANNNDYNLTTLKALLSPYPAELMEEI